jgi:hypothetical protein
MRINIYSEEIDGEVELVEKKVRDSDDVFYGCRVNIISPNQLHEADKSAVTFWFADLDQADDLCSALAEALAQ